MKIIPVFLSIVILTVYIIFHGTSVSFAQHIGNQKNTIPSDLLLDLRLAQQNSDPDRKKIIDSQVNKVVLTTTSGEVTTEIPQPTIDPKATMESTDNVLDPQLTTSEQVVTEPVTIEDDKNGNPSDTPVPDNHDTISPTGESDTNNSLIPGTDITAPDDNAAPGDNSTDPNLPAPTQQEQNPSISPTDQQNLDTTNGNQNTPSDQVTPSSENATVTPSPDTTTDTSGQNIPLESSPQDNAGSSQSDTSGSSSTDQSTTDTPTPDASVQGAAIGPQATHGSLLQRFVDSIVSFLTGK